VLQRVAECCSVLQCIAACYIHVFRGMPDDCEKGTEMFDKSAPKSVPLHVELVE